ncbi:MAG: nodulation protein NfeD [Deltaproteobacteria bacterium]|nr:nodulation protein NfeD [Deltaproteobacteria bacterium]
MRPVALVELDGSVNPGSAGFLVRAIERAPSEGYQAIVIRLDTPGGMVESTREIVKAELASPIPVIVWIGPGGARAGSAGVFITLASHVAAMAPATNIGAAHPVAMGPGGGTEKPDETMNEKITNDLAAWAEGIAQQRRRNVEWAAKAVRDSVSVPAEEALRLKVIDVISSDVTELVRGLDGKEIETALGKARLETLGVPLAKISMTPRERLLDALGDPNFAFLFIGLGMLGILAELYHPGTIFPGVLGAISLAIGLIATRMLPVRTGALVLMLAGGVLIAAEFYVATGWGLLAIGGILCLGIGGFLLVDPANPSYLVDRDFGVDWTMVLPVLLTVGAVLAVVVWKVAASRRMPETVGEAGLVGEEGVVLDQVGPTSGQIRVHGELWQARAAQPLAPGLHVKVVKVEGLVATVTPKDVA